MDEQILWVWNGWGMLFTACIAIWQFLHILVTIKLGPGTPLRGILFLILLVSLPLVFVFSGWVAGILALPIGMVVGVMLARLLLPRPI